MAINTFPCPFYSQKRTIGKIRVRFASKNWTYLISDGIANSSIWYHHFIYDRQIHCKFTDWQIFGYKTQMAQILFSESSMCTPHFWHTGFSASKAPKSVFVSIFKYCTCQYILTVYANLSGAPTPANPHHSCQRTVQGLVRLV